MKISHAKHMTRPTAAQGRQRGYTLIELSIALAIISVIIVGSLVGVQRILANNRANNLLSDFPRINAALVGASSNAATFAGMTTTRAASLGAFNPANVAWNADNSKANVTNAFGGKLFVQGSTATIGESTRGYVVTATNIPQDMCATVVNGLAPLAQALWVNKTTDEPTGDLTQAPGDTLIKGPAQNSTIDLDKMAQQCRASTTGNTSVNAYISL